MRIYSGKTRDQTRKSNILEHKVIAMEEETGARQHLLLCALNSRLTSNQTHSVSLQNVHPEFSKGIDARVPQLQNQQENHFSAIWSNCVTF